MARHRLGRPRRRLSVRLHAVLACRPCRGAAMGMALALLPRHPASVARALDPHRHQGKPTLRARHHADAQGGAQEATRYPIAGARIPARNADRLARLLFLSLHLARLVGLDAVLPRHGKEARLPGHGQLPLDLDVLRHLRLLDLRLAVRHVRATLGDPGSRGAGVGASFTFGLGVASLAPMIMGWIATAYSVAAGLPLLACSFLLLAPLFVWFAPDTTRKELTDFVGQKAG